LGYTNAIVLLVAGLWCVIFFGKIAFKLATLRFPELKSANAAVPVILPLAGLWFGYLLVNTVMGWDGAKIRPRLALWWTVTGCLWLGTVLAILHFNWHNYVQIWNTNELPPLNFALTWLSIWPLLALLVILPISFWPNFWRNYSTFTWLILASVTVAGYPAAWFLYVAGSVFVGFPLWMIIVYFLAPPLLLPLLGTLTALVFGVVIWLVTWAFFFLLRLPIYIFDFIDEQRKETQIRQQKKQGLSNYFSRFHLWLRHEPVPEIPDDSKGSRFSTPSEASALQKPGGAPYGYIEGKPYFLHTEKHVLIQASTRSGKGVAVIIPRLLLYPGSAFVLDPKGENGRATGRRRAQLNDKVHYLDPFGISGRPGSRFNPLSRFTPENMEAESKALAAALVLADTRDHWNAAGQQLLAAIIMYVYSSTDIAPEQKDLVTVRRFLLGGIELALNGMKRMEDVADGLLASLAKSFLDTPEKEFGSIVSTAQRETEILDNPELRKSLMATGEGDEVDFAQWHTGTMTVYLCLAAPKFPVFSRWLRLVLTSALDEMTDKLRPPPLPVVFLLDELATLGHLSTVENAIGLSAGYGVQIVSVFQDVAQMRDLYKGRWTSFVGNAGVRVLFNLDDFETADYWSKFIGGRLVETLNVSEDIYGIAEKQSRGEAVRPLLTPDEIMLRFAGGDIIPPEAPGGLATMGKMLLLPQGSRPIITDRVPYFKDPHLKGLWDDPRATAAH
jgi:type IV secretion system protein VirD4